MKRLQLFGIGVLVQAGHIILALVVIRWGFQHWPTGSYTWIPALRDVTGLLVLLFLYRYLSARGLSFLALVGVWYCGRVVGELGSALVAHDDVVQALVTSASFGLLVFDPGRPISGFLSLPSALATLGILAGAYWWGRRSKTYARTRASSD